MSEEEVPVKKRKRLQKSKKNNKKKKNKNKHNKRTKKRRQNVSSDSDSSSQRVSPIVSDGEDSARSSLSPRPSPPSPTSSPKSPSTPRPPSPLPQSQGYHLSAKRIPVVLRIQTSKGKSLHFATHIFFGSNKGISHIGITSQTSFKVLQDKINRLLDNRNQIGDDKWGYQTFIYSKTLAQTNLAHIKTTQRCGVTGQPQILREIRSTYYFLYAVGQIAYKVRQQNRSGVMLIRNFISIP